MRVFQTLSLATAAAANDRKVHLINGCDEPLTITGANGSPNLGVLQTGGSMTQTPIGGGKYEAYYSESDIGQAKCNSFEYQVKNYSADDQWISGGPRNVGLFTIPVTVKCAADGRTTGCTNNPTSSDVRAAMSHCPTARPEFASVSDSRVCYSAMYACEKHPDAPYCGNNASVPMQRALRRFGGGRQPDSSRAAYGCFWSFTDDPVGCARLNRGVSDPGGDPSSFYTAEEDGVPLYNEYAKWVHELCGINDMAFNYDDYGNHSGYMECFGDMTVTFCSGGSIVV